MISKDIKKVCLIVDNPKRDIDGLALVGWYLIKKNIDVIFVPMYEWHEVFFIKPDLVLVNYTRLANNKMISRCKELKIAVGVLDTEGGILRNVDEYFGKAMRYGENVDFYCTWGKKQYDAIIAQNALDKTKVALTGCPRYDFGAKPWDNTLINNRNSKKRKMVLINTNFPFINPKYNTPGKELKDLIEKEGYDKQFANELFEQTIKTNEKFNDVILKLSNDFPQLDFIIRPHPFESIEQYITLTKNQGNVQVIQDGTVFSWIAKSDLLIHQNCSTAVESILLNVEPINLRFISGSLLKQPVSAKVSFNVDSYEKLYETVDLVQKGEQLQVSESLKVERKKIIEDWFYKNDGKASERVADKIEEILIKRYNDNVKTDYNFFQLYFSNIKYRDYKKIISQLIFQIFGASGLKIIKSIFMSIDRRRDIGEKNISINNVKEIVSRLSTVDKIKNNYTIDYFSIKKFSSILMKKT